MIIQSDSIMAAHEHHHDGNPSLQGRPSNMGQKPIEGDKSMAIQLDSTMAAHEASHNESSHQASLLQGRPGNIGHKPIEADKSMDSTMAAHEASHNESPHQTSLLQGRPSNRGHRAHEASFKLPTQGEVHSTLPVDNRGRTSSDLDRGKILSAPLNRREAHAVSPKNSSSTNVEAIQGEVCQPPVAASNSANCKDPLTDAYNPTSEEVQSPNLQGGAPLLAKTKFSDVETQPAAHSHSDIPREGEIYKPPVTAIPSSDCNPSNNLTHGELLTGGHTTDQPATLQISKKDSHK